MSFSDKSICLGEKNFATDSQKEGMTVLKRGDKEDKSRVREREKSVGSSGVTVDFAYNRKYGREYRARDTCINFSRPIVKSIPLRF